MWALDKVERKFINNNQAYSNVGNNWGELSEDDSNNPNSNNPNSNTTGRDSIREKYNKGHTHTLYTGTRRECQEDM